MLTELLFQILVIPFEAFKHRAKDYYYTNGFTITRAFLKLDFESLSSHGLPAVTTELDKNFIRDLVDDYQGLIAYIMHMHLNARGFGLWYVNAEEEEMWRESFAYRHIFNHDLDHDELSNIGKGILDKDFIYQDLTYLGDNPVIKTLEEDETDRNFNTIEQSYINAVVELYKHAMECESVLADWSPEYPKN